MRSTRGFSSIRSIVRFAPVFSIALALAGCSTPPSAIRDLQIDGATRVSVVGPSFISDGPKAWVLTYESSLPTAELASRITAVMARAGYPDGRSYTEGTTTYLEFGMASAVIGDVGAVRRVQIAVSK